MNELGFENALATMTMAESLIQAVLTIGMLAFIGWNIKLVLED